MKIKKNSEKYYQMAIEQRHIGAMLKYANPLLDGLYGEDKRINSEQYYLMAIENKDFDSIYKEAVSVSKELLQKGNSDLSKQKELIDDKDQLGNILSLILLTELFSEFNEIEFSIDYWLNFKEIQCQAIFCYANKLSEGVYGSDKINLSGSSFCIKRTSSERKFKSFKTTRINQ
jgi:hypothetical protein